MSENAAAKGRRYLVEGRLVVDRVDKDSIRATCRGNGALYRVRWNPGEGWSCDCPAYGRCAHLYALMSVCVRESA